MSLTWLEVYWLHWWYLAHAAVFALVFWLTSDDEDGPIRLNLK